MSNNTSEQDTTQATLKEAPAQANVTVSGDYAADISPRSETSVSSGEVKTCKGEGILRAGAIGSCVVVAAYDPTSGVGGMAHVMLPGDSGGRAPSGNMRYAEDAIPEVLRRMAALGADQTRIHACLVGGGNVLGDGHDSPGPEIVRSVAEILDKREITPAAMDVGGTQRRSCALDVAVGRVTYTIGDSRPRVLWESGSTRLGQGESAGQKVREDEGGVRT